MAQKLRAPASWGSRSLPFSSSQHPDRQLAQQRQQRTEGIRAQSESGPPPTWMLPQFQPRPSTGQSARLQPSAQAQQPEQLDLPAQPVVHKSMLASASKRSHNGAIKLPSSQGPASQPIECGMTGTAEGHHLSDPEHDKEPTVAEKLLSMGFEPYSFEVSACTLVWIDLMRPLPCNVQHCIWHVSLLCCSFSACLCYPGMCVWQELCTAALALA